MRITDGKNPLDATGVHPESYDATKKLLDKVRIYHGRCQKPESGWYF